MRIYLLALLVKNLAVAALGSGNKEYHVFAGSKLTQVPYAVGYLTANCVVIFKMNSRARRSFISSIISRKPSSDFVVCE